MFYQRGTVLHFNLALCHSIIFKMTKSKVPAINLMNMTTYLTNVKCFGGRFVPK